jgi:hypothetical protein
MTHTNAIADARQVLAMTEEMVSRIEQNQWAYKMVAPEELRQSQNFLVWYIADCEAGEEHFEESEFTANIVEFTKEIMLADKILSEI